MFVWTLSDAIGVGFIFLFALLVAFGLLVQLARRLRSAAARGIRRLYDYFPPTLELPAWLRSAPSPRSTPSRCSG